MDPTSTPPITQPAVTPIENSAVLPSTPVNKIWSKTIPYINVTFMTFSVMLVFGLDLIILIFNFSLVFFWIIMLVVFGLFVIFFRLENYLFNKKFAKSKSALDPWIGALIVLRNLVFILNFIPGIQIIGAMIFIVAIWPYIILYSILTSSRSKAV